MLFSGAMCDEYYSIEQVRHMRVARPNSLRSPVIRALSTRTVPLIIMILHAGTTYRIVPAQYP
jgi:hypothetical protein